MSWNPRLAEVLERAAQELDNFTSLNAPGHHPASLRALWKLSHGGTCKLADGDMTPELLALAELSVDCARSRRAQYFNPGPGDFIKSLATKRGLNLTVAQARGVCNTLIASLRSQRKRFYDNSGDGFEPDDCIVCGVTLIDPTACAFGVGDTCWQRMHGNWGF
jgi:hypothetical protein